MKAECRLMVTSSMGEKLIQQALVQGACFHSLRRSGSRRIIADCSEESADILLALCKRYHLDCRILRRRGKSTLLAKIRSRITLPAGILLSVLLCQAFLSRVWLIDVSFTGPSAALGQESAIRACLEELHIRPGMKRREIDTSLLQKQLLASAGAYSHIGLQLRGIRLLAEAAPEVPSPETYVLETPRDLVAAADGVVKSVNVRSGTACIAPGDTVRKGQLLIRGEEEKSEEETAVVSALGEVHLRSWVEGSAEGSLLETRIRRTGRTSSASALRLMNRLYPLASSETFATEETETQILPIVGLFIPLEIIRETRFETESVEANADEIVLEGRLRCLAQAEAKRNLSLSGLEDYEIADYWEEFIQTDNLLRLRAVYEITFNAAVTRGALTDIGG